MPILPLVEVAQLSLSLSVRIVPLYTYTSLSELIVFSLFIDRLRHKDFQNKLIRCWAMIYSAAAALSVAALSSHHINMPLPP